MSEDKARFLEVVGRAFGDDEVCYVSYVLGLEYDALCLFFLSHDDVHYLMFPILEDGKYFVCYRLYVCVDEVLQLAVCHRE